MASRDSVEQDIAAAAVTAHQPECRENFTLCLTFGFYRRVKPISDTGYFIGKSLEFSQESAHFSRQRTIIKLRLYHSLSGKFEKQSRKLPLYLLRQKTVIFSMAQRFTLLCAFYFAVCRGAGCRAIRLSLISGQFRDI